MRSDSVVEELRRVTVSAANHEDQAMGMTRIGVLVLLQCPENCLGGVKDCRTAEDDNVDGQLAASRAFVLGLPYMF